MSEEIKQEDQENLPHEENKKELHQRKLESTFTQNFPQILEKLGISIAVTTYQAGKLILLRNMDGKLNTHYRSFKRPMGLCANHRYMYLGDNTRIIKFRNVPNLTAKLDPPNKVDKCFIPRNIHVTGGIDIHEMDMDKDGDLWFINTRFSTLCKLDYDNSFIPVWRPKFITGLAHEDRCHLNGLCMIDGKPKYLTALGKTDTKGGWRENKRNGGIMIDFDTNDIVLEKLSMPHSPRWYRDKLWVLESGEGSISTVDLDKKELTHIAKLPGFTRGLDFIGPLAFIGLSQIRESATFSGLPLTERLEERICGVWVVNIETGETLGHVKFTSGVEEIFAVKILHNSKFPDVLNPDDELLKTAFMLPEEYMKDVAVQETAE